MKTIEIIADLIHKYAARACFVICLLAITFIVFGCIGKVPNGDAFTIRDALLVLFEVAMCVLITVKAYAEHIKHRAPVDPPCDVAASCDTEAMIQQKGANVAPRITPADIEANIAHECYFVAADALRFSYVASDIDGADREAKNGIREGMKTRSYSGVCIDIDANAFIPESTKLLTFCVLVLRNGFTVTGESACASPENFNVEIGRKIARENAIAKIWPLMGYELRSKLAAGHGDQ